ncbi:hypothetical protein [uncultured Methanobrevibacter sp.]|uniref:hypothetical protein n=1 Tax=uncultured Methanobrevibacter sp. TaxID=253161 RepID=UPI0025CC931D|nr:hypothetical protein [uncultured Methanobrevibacter sp.]
MNISKETILRLSEEYLWGFDNKDLTFGDELGRTGEDLRSSKNYTKDFIDKNYDYICKNAEVICIVADAAWITGGESIYYGIRINAPKNKEVTLDYIHQRIEKINSARGFSLYEDMTKFIKKYKVPAEATSFGLSIWIAFGNHDKQIETINKILTDKGIQYTTRLSPAGWCYNWVISKHKNNVALIRENNNHVKYYNEWKS